MIQIILNAIFVYAMSKSVAINLVSKNCIQKKLFIGHKLARKTGK